MSPTNNEARDDAKAIASALAADERLRALAEYNEFWDKGLRPAAFVGLR